MEIRGFICIETRVLGVRFEILSEKLSDNPTFRTPFLLYDIY